MKRIIDSTSGTVLALAVACGLFAAEEPARRAIARLAVRSLPLRAGGAELASSVAELPAVPSVPTLPATFTMVPLAGGDADFALPNDGNPEERMLVSIRSEGPLAPRSLSVDRAHASGRTIMTARRAPRSSADRQGPADRDAWARDLGRRVRRACGAEAAPVLLVKPRVQVRAHVWIATDGSVRAVASADDAPTVAQCVERELAAIRLPASVTRREAELPLYWLNQ